MVRETLWKNQTEIVFQSISQQGTTTSINEKMDFMIPAGKIAALRTGEMVGMIAQGEEKTIPMNTKHQQLMEKSI